MKFLLAAVALAIVTPVVAQGGPETVMRTEAGLVRGVAGGGLVSWKGIPFAAPPVGALRWRNPQPPVPWSGVREAGVFGPACMQTDDVPKSEDCLTLNVWRPAAAKAPLPVMAWIYGGAMVHGNTAMYPFDAMAAKGIVIVSMNYRLGRLGFFAHPALAAESPGDVRGNYGYMDQLAALKWIQRNIAAFGGDPSAVTIFGESAGGGSVLAHLVSPMSRGLFRGAILQSPGTPSARAKAVPSSALAAAEKSVLDWSRSIGIAGDGAGALAQLRALPPEQLLEGASPSETLKALALGTTPPGMAMSIVDGRFLPEPPEAALAAGRYAAVPVMVGANDRDLPVGFARSADEIYASFGSDAREARRIYDPLGNLELDELKQQVFADKAMLEPTRHLANELARAGRPVWLYRFEYVSGAQRGKNMGALHGFEIPFTLNVPDAMVGPAQVTGIDRQTADAASGYWVQFGLTGDPNGGGRLAWPRHDVKVDRLLHFTNSGLIVGTDPVKARLDLVERARAREGR